MLGSFMVNTHSLTANSSSPVPLVARFSQPKNKLKFPSIKFRSCKRRLHLRKIVRTPKAALTEDWYLPKVAEEEPLTLNVAASVTVRSRRNVYMAAMMLHWLDAFTYPAEKGVVLQLVSTELDPGAITVCNKYKKEFFWVSIAFQGFVHFACNSWVQPAKVHSSKRIFFTNKVESTCPSSQVPKVHQFKIAFKSATQDCKNLRHTEVENA